MTAVPPLPPDRSRRVGLRPRLSHDDRRIARHCAGYIDPQRIRTAYMHIVVGRWAALLGDPNAAPVRMGADVIRLPPRDELGLRV